MATEFGQDVLTIPVYRSGRLTKGVMTVAQNAYNCLRTPYGILRENGESADWGFDLAGFIGTIQTEAQAASVPSRIATALRKDERITDVRTIVRRTEVSPGLEAWDLDITCMTDEGPFTLQTRAEGLTLELVNISAGGSA